MIRNYFKIAFRTIRKNGVTTAINVIGLTAGLTCCLLMILYMQHELSYDRFHKNSDRIVRVIMEYGGTNGNAAKGNFTSTRVWPAFQRNFSEVESGVRMEGFTGLVKVGDQVYTEPKFLIADSTFFSVFSFPLLQGNPQTVLQAPHSVVISAPAAKKYFGDENPVGKIIQVGSRQENFTVTGLAVETPANSQIRFDFIASYSTWGPLQEETYFNANSTTYLLLKDAASIQTLQSKIPAFMKEEVKTGYDPGTFINFELEPLTKVHLYSPYDGFEPNGNIYYVYSIGLIALLILLIACFTYINLSTARSMNRAKEIGVRKVSGAMKSQVFWQFISESLLLVLISLGLSVVFAAAVIPYFNELTGKTFSLHGLLTLPVLLASLLMAVVIAFFAGSYPAVLLARLQPVAVLKGSFRSAEKGKLLRKSLIVFQFTVSVFLIVATLIVQDQLNFIQHKKLGFEKEHVLAIPIDQRINEKSDLFKTSFAQYRGVKGVSKSIGSPVQIVGGYTLKSNLTGAGMNVKACPVDEDYIRVNGMEILGGLDFTKQDVKDVSFPYDSLNRYHFILNETAVKALGWTSATAVGKTVYLGDQRPGIVKAVVKDFHFASLHSSIEPLVLFPGAYGDRLLLKIEGNDIPGTLQFLEKEWKKLAPHRPFEYTFLDQEFDRLYETEKRTSNVFGLFSVLAILLACLGLFGLSVFASKLRTKEIGVRKVLGATINGLVFLLARDFLLLVALAIVIATPLAVWVMHHWLQDFAYRVPITLMMFVLPALLALTIAFLTVSFQAVQTALTNPVKSLRTE